MGVHNCSDQAPDVVLPSQTRGFAVSCLKLSTAIQRDISCVRFESFELPAVTGTGKSRLAGLLSGHC